MSSFTDVVTVVLLPLAGDVVVGSGFAEEEEDVGSGSRYDRRSIASTQFSGRSCGIEWNITNGVQK